MTFSELREQIAQGMKIAACNRPEVQKRIAEQQRQREEKYPLLKWFGRPWWRSPWEVATMVLTALFFGFMYLFVTYPHFARAVIRLFHGPLPGDPLGTL